MKRGLLYLIAASAAVLAMHATAFADTAGRPVGDNVPLTPNTLCGAEGVGMMNDGGKLVRWQGHVAEVGEQIYDELSNLQHRTMAVGHDGRWFTCQPWIKPGQAPSTPKPDNRPCPGGTGEVAIWTINKSTCTSYDPTRSSPGDKSRIQGTKAGELEAFHATGRQIGTGVFRCEGGQRVLQPGSTCVEAVECAGKVSGTWGSGNACGVDYEGRLPFGKAIAVSSTRPGGSGSAKLYCNPTTGQFQLIGGDCRAKK